MKGKLIVHYFISFIVACSIIFIVNIVFMLNNIYNQGTLYNYQPEHLISEVSNYIIVSNSNSVVLNEEGIEKLNRDKIGLQILDKENKEVYSYNKPKGAPVYYSAKDIIEMFESEENTLFLEEKVLEDKIYTYLLFLDTSKVNRIIYSYDVPGLRKAHHFPILIGINIGLILIMSILFTIRISNPIYRIINKIVDLSNGKYSRTKVNKGIYFKVEDRLNQLGDRLNSNEIERLHLDEMREEWISNITHDIKTPLTSIIGNAEILGDTEYELDNNLRVKKCNTIISKSQYIKTLVEDLNLSTRLKNNTITLNKKRVNIVSLARHVLIDIINDEKYNDRNIKFNYSDEEIYLELDERLIKRVFVNLIINAFIHNDSNVKVKIDITKNSNEEVSIIIKDNGKGVSKEDLENIFRRYYRGTNTTKKIEGSGLGMAIAHDIIMSHNGKITAVSDLGEGLQINITLN